MSRNMNVHSYVPFTGKPYIYYNGIPYVVKNSRNCDEHPYRTIVRTNVDDCRIVRSVPVGGMGIQIDAGKIKCDAPGCKYDDRWDYALFRDNCNYSANNLFR